MAIHSAQFGTTATLWLLSIVVALTGACVKVEDAGAERVDSGASEQTRSDASALDAANVPGPDAAADRAQLPSSDGGGPHSAQSTTFVLENRGAQPIVLGTSCGGSWLRIERAGREIAIDRFCRCSCSEMESVHGCLGCPAVCTSTQKQLAPGMSERLAWDGIQLDQPSGKSCYDEAAFAVGTELTATACWNVDQQTGKGTCASKTFVYGKEREVVLRAQPVASLPSASTLTLENRTASTIEITERCGGIWSWFDIKAPGVMTSTAAFCPCPCDEQYGLAGCADCGGCAEDIVHKVAPGATYTSTWDGTLVYSYPSGCAEHFAVPTGSPLTVEFCWRRSGEDAGAEQCRQSPIVHGASEVTLVAQ